MNFSMQSFAHRLFQARLSGSRPALQSAPGVPLDAGVAGIRPAHAAQSPSVHVMVGRRIDRAALVGWGLLGAALAASLGTMGWRLANGAPDALATVAAALVVFLASVIASIGGFAFAAIAGAGLIHVVDDPVSMVRTILVCSVAIQAYGTWALRRSVKIRSLLPYVAGGTIGAPIGVSLLVLHPSSTYTLILGSIVLLYAGYMLVFAKRTRKLATNAARDGAVGVAGGVLAGLAGFPGGPTSVWCGLQGMAKDAQRALMQPFILVMQVQALVWLSIFGRSKLGELGDAALYMPVALLAATVGLKIFQRLGNDQFRLVVNLLLAVCGGLMIGKALGQ